MKPAEYPLPWFAEFDVPYWQVNALLCGRSQLWVNWQTTRSMAQIIPVLRWLLLGAVPA